MDSLILLARGFEFAGKAVASAEGTSLDAPTPCTSWTLRNLLNHLIGIPDVLFRSVDGELLGPDDFSPDVMAGIPAFDTDPLGAYERAVARALEACARPGALDGFCTMARGETPLRALATAAFSDSLAHGWDVAQASGRPVTIPDELAGPAAGFMATFISPGARSGAHRHFAPQLPTAESTSAGDRLIAFLGRTPDWRTPGRRDETARSESRPR